MTACNSLTNLSTAENRKRDLPQNLTAKCENLHPIDGTTGGEVLTWITGAIFKYKECQNRHNKLVDALENDE